MSRCSKKSSRLNRERWTEPKHKNGMYRRRKQGQATHKEYGSITWVWNVGLLLNKVDNRVPKDTQMFKVVFALAFTSKVSSQAYLIPLSSSKACEREVLPMVEDNQVRNYLSRLDTHKFIGLDGMHLKVLRNLVHVIARFLSLIFKRSCW